MASLLRRQRISGDKRREERWLNAAIRSLLLIGLICASGACSRWRAGSPAIPPASEAAPDAEERAAFRKALEEYLRRAPKPEGSYRIGPNDVVEITVYRQPDMNTTVRVDGDGLVRFPPLGELNVGGLTERQLEALLQDKLAEKRIIKDPQVKVFVSEPHPKQIDVFGAVRSPGRYPYAADMRLMDAIAAAGGPAADAGTVAYIIRYGNSPGKPSVEGNEPSGVPEEQTIAIDLDGLLVKGEGLWNVPMMPGDLVNIPVPEPGWVHVTGLGIATPGTYPLITFLGLQGREVSRSGAEGLVPYPLTRSSKTLRQAIDEAGGLKFEASTRIVVLRKHEDGRSVMFTKNYREILKDPTRDIPLQTQDTVIVNRSLPRYVVYLVASAATEIIRITIHAEYDLFNQEERRLRQAQKYSTAVID